MCSVSRSPTLQKAFDLRSAQWPPPFVKLCELVLASSKLRYCFVKGATHELMILRLLPCPGNGGDEGP